MASFGKVLDILDDRYLGLQDVIGNVESLPTLVPYENYTQNVLVYRMDTNHEIFMALIQDFTERTARETGKELWTWCVQWEVEDRTSTRLDTSAHSPKRPRLDPDLSEAPLNAPQPQRRAPAFDMVERRIINPELMQEEDMLRILIDIIQVDSSIVPNFIEFLYRWIDFYEGDGKALKAALRHEIPSLWDFEYHPLILPEEVRKMQTEQEKAKNAGLNGAIKDAEMGETGNKTPNSRKAEELAQGSPTKKMREKPDLAAIERHTQESERLQYREVKYGIQPPKLNEPLPPLINIPRDRRRRIKYYAACFRSRQRALNLLVEAGITIPQISNYEKRQVAHPRDTPLGGEGNGLRHYHKDAQYAQERYVEKEKEMELREKNVEIAISNKLAAEAQLAAATAKPEGSSGVPLIPPTPSYERQPNMAAAMLSKIHAARRQGEDRINVVPTPLVGKMKSKLFEGAKDRQAFNTLGQSGGTRQNASAIPPFPVQNEESKSDSDQDTDSDDNSPRPSLPFSLLPPPRSLAAPTLLGASSGSSVYASPLQQNDTSALVTVSSDAPNPANVVEYIRNLSPEQAQQLLPLLNSRVRQAMANRIGGQPPGVTAHPPESTSLSARNSLPQLPRLPPFPMAPSLSAPVSPPAFAQRLLAIQRNQTTAMQGEELHNAATTIPQSPTSRSGFSSTVEEYLALRREHEAWGQTQVPTQASARPPLVQSLLQRPNMVSSSITRHPSPIADGPSIPSLTFPMTTPAPVTQPQLPQSSTLSTSLTQPGSSFSPPRPSIQRNAPSPLNLAPPTSPLSSLAPSLLATSPFAASANGLPIQIYFPKIVVPGNTIGPGGAKLGNGGIVETDAFLVGYAQPGSGKIVLSKAIFLPVGVWTNTLRRVRRGAYTVLETYAAPRSHPKLAAKPPPRSFAATVKSTNPNGPTPHRTIYTKLAQAYTLVSSSKNREQDLTKRWRVTKGPMTRFDRGAVWEGWAAVLDKGIEMSSQERMGAVISSGLIDGGVKKKRDADEIERERRRKEIEELMALDSDEDMEG
ncbi:uncharacterized protein K460DRAFT_270192 [Cucurbitaria berberidis CBS 394.84]|uniref:Uncharacterized protein n=1 Tax=Cucurbitaria berberidis CBS 394.84 TaxID=1168544 RepID=A0A9P4LBU2_9PLEO|nr:uncharacterized protein K460DRAFT_270192 [Cucurbitaria berberidis CBS 394.84]KAF1849951.1 hypothetical protein K460DRAFT_270192 [Cucurbitaria berberidis CBS 394.84]